MAGWLSSKLKEAENFLQQIDQQAAESLGKPEKQPPGVVPGISEEKHGKWSKTLDLSLDQKGILKQAFVDNKLASSSQPTYTGLSKIPKQAFVDNKLASSSQPIYTGLSKIPKLDEGKKELYNPRGHGGKETHASKKKEPASALTPPVGYSENTQRDDWTELLASPSTSLLSSPGLSSSVGSSDSSGSVVNKVTSSKSTPSTGRNGGHFQRSTRRKESLVNQQLQGPLPTPHKNPSHEKLVLVDPNAVASQNLELDLSLNIGRQGHSDKRAVEHASLADADDTSFIDPRPLLAQVKDASSVRKAVPSKAETSMRDDSIGHKGGLETCATHLSEDGAVAIARNSGENGGSDHVNNTDWHLVRENSPGFAVEGTDLLPAHSFDFASASKGLVEENHFKDTKTVGELSSTKEQLHSFSAESYVNEKNNTLEESEEGHAEILEKGGRFLRRLNEGQGEVKVLEAGNRSLERSKDPTETPVTFESDMDSYESGSETATDSPESEDEEIERRKSAHKRRIAKRKEVAALRAAAAELAVKQHEELVEKLEKEKISLEHILAEREEQQGKEAAELRLSTAEVLEALEMEKKAHSSTRMEALSKESQLENQNAILAKVLGASQWELEERVTEVMKARNIAEAKDVGIADLRRRVAKLHQELSQQSGESDLAGKCTHDEESFEEEHTVLWSRIQQCQIQAKDLELKINSLKESQLVLTETEVELDNHLAQMTDQLIQKQAQVESLSSEKGTLMIRLEALSNTMQEEKATASSRTSRTKIVRGIDWSIFEDAPENRKVRPGVFAYDVESTAMLSSSSSLPFSPIVHQLDALFSAGVFFLRRHRWAQAFALVYIIGLHIWVLFILFNHSNWTQTSGLQELALPTTTNTSSGLPGGANISHFF